MNKLALTLTAVLMGTAAYAAVTAEDVAAILAKQGYTNIEVETKGDRIEAEATKDGQEHEIVFDASTGDVLSNEVDSDEDGDGDEASGGEASGEEASGGEASGGEASGGEASGGEASGGDGSAGSAGSADDQAMLNGTEFDYLNGGNLADISFG